MSNLDLRGVYIKLGTDCNLHCKYCHSEHLDYEFNLDILPILKKLKLRVIAFGGGEPLLYWQTIRKIMLYVGKDVHYKIVTNGTLLTKEIVDFCNQYTVFFSISLDGLHSTRDNSKPIQWDIIKRLNRCGTAVTFYKETSNIRESLESLNNYKRNYLSVKPVIWSSFPNYVHSTVKTGVVSDKSLADSYIKQMTDLTEEAIRIYKKGNGHMTLFLKRVFDEFVKIKGFHGVRCCNSNNILMLADGTICVCTYKIHKVGDIFNLNKINWNQIQSEFSRESCKSCNLFDVCGNHCCMNVTDDECYIMQKLNFAIISLMKKYDITYDELCNC